MYVCVFGIIVLNIFAERWSGELKMLTGSLVELHTWLHSYLSVFSLLEKRFLSYLDTSSIPPRPLAICWAFKLYSYRNLNKSSIARWIDRESSWTIDSFSTVGGSIELLFLCLYFVPRHLLDGFICRRCFLDTFLNRWLDTFIYQELLKLYILVCRDPVLISSICLHLFTSQITLSHSKPLSQVFFKLFQVFFTW